jgi:hypothetical protein
MPYHLGALTPADQTQVATLGLYTQPDVGTAYPELRDRVLELYNWHVMRLPFLPDGWIDEVQAAFAADPSSILLMIPAHDNAGGVTQGLPSWLAQEGARTAWDSARKRVMEGYMQWVQGEIDNGRAALWWAQLDIGYWNTLIAIAKVAEKPLTLPVDWFVTWLKDFFAHPFSESNLPFTLAAIGGAGYLGYHVYRDATRD